jgi:DNA ligase 1
MKKPGTFHSLCFTVQSIHECSDYDKKITHLSRYFSKIKNTDHLNLSARFLTEGVFDPVSGIQPAIGSYTISTAAAQFCEIDYEQVFKPCRKVLTGTPETIEKLMENIDEARAKRVPRDISLADVVMISEELNHLKKRSDKQQCLIRIWQNMSTIEIRYLTQLLMKKSLLNRNETGTVIGALSHAFSMDQDKIRFAHSISGSMGQAAVSAMTDRIDDLTLRIFHPQPFMLPASSEKNELQYPNEYIAEENFNGIRCQFHSDGKSVKLYSRTLKDITSSFPDLFRMYGFNDIPPCVIDGVLCAYKNHTFQSSQLLRKRIQTGSIDEQLKKQYPVLFIAFDILFIGGKLLFDESLKHRRQLLERLGREYAVPVSEQFHFSSHQELITLYNRSLGHGNTGLILKNTKSAYKYGERHNSWLKMSKPKKSFKTIVMYAHRKSRHYHQYISELTLGISVISDDRYEESFIPIGRVNNNLPEKDQKRFLSKMNDLTVERYGPTLGLIPELVAEIEFDEIFINDRTKAGYKLRSPRLIKMRWDSSPDQAVTLSDIETVYRETIGQNQLNDTGGTSFRLNDP